MDSGIPELGDEVGFCGLVRQAIERAQAKDIPDADERVWIGCIEAQYQQARWGQSSCTRVAR